MSATPRPWTNGYGSGITGPTTPSISGVTVAEYLQMEKYRETDKDEDYPYSWYKVISRNGQTIAIIPSIPEMHQEGADNAELIVRCVNSHDDLLKALAGMIRRFEEKTGERPHGNCGCTYCWARDIYEKATAKKL